MAFSNAPDATSAAADDAAYTAPEPAISYSRGLTGNYLSGRFAANTGDYEHANLYLTRTLRMDPDNLGIAGYAYRMKLITGELNQAEELAQKLYAADDEASSPEIMVLLSALKKGDYSYAETVLAEFERQGFNQVVVPLIEAWVKVGQGKLESAFTVDDMIGQVAEFAPFLYYQAALINDMAGYESVALSQYEKALENSATMPHRVVTVLGNLYERRAEWDKADALYARFNKERSETSLPVESHGWMRERGQLPERLISNAQQGVAEIFFSIANILHHENLNEEALIYVQEALYLHPRFDAANLMLGTVQEKLGDHADALETYAKLLPGTPYHLKAQLRSAYVLHEQGEVNGSLEALARLAALDEPEFAYQVNLARGDILMREKRFAEAMDTYTQAIGDNALGQDQWPVLYARGISAERSGNWDMAERDFLKALELEPNQPDVMNYLGYSWLTQKMRMDEAREMIAKAVRARPTDAHIIDSMGWALYVMGEYPESAKYLERAVELMPTDPTVNEHLGDVYWQLGRKTEARFQWQRAVIFGAEDDQLTAINQKLKDGMEVAEGVEAIDGSKPQQRADITSDLAKQPTKP